MSRVSVRAVAIPLFTDPDPDCQRAENTTLNPDPVPES